MLPAVSSEAMLGGQKSPYKLLVRAVNQLTGQEVPYITFVASEDFVVSVTSNASSDTSFALKQRHSLALVIKASAINQHTGQEVPITFVASEDCVVGDSCVCTQTAAQRSSLAYTFLNSGSPTALCCLTSHL